MSDTLKRIMNHWTDAEQFQGESGCLNLPFNLELFCAENDALIAKLEAALPEEIERCKQLALRQYRHNYAEKAVFGYDKELMDVFIERLARELSIHQKSKFRPDWSLLKATQDSLREHMALLKHAQSRIEELEAKLEAATKALERLPAWYEKKRNTSVGGFYSAEVAEAIAALKSIKEE